MLGQVGVGFALGAWNKCTVAEGPHLRVALAPHGCIDNDVSALVLLHGKVGHDRVGNDSRRQDDGFRFDRFFRQVDLARLNGTYHRVGPDIGSTPLAEHSGSVLRQLAG